MQQIQLRGKHSHLFTLVDDEDFGYLSQFKWNALEDNAFTPSVIGKVKGRKCRMARLIMNVLDNNSVVIDHINGNGLDNRKENLRICSIRQNLQNRRKTSSKCTSKYKGVSWDSSRNKWQVHGRTDNGKTRNLGRYDNEEDAAQKYNEWALATFKEFSKLNCIERKK